MDGNKKIKGIVFAGIIALAITACRVQPPGYVGLYVDNLISVTDTTDPGVMVDTAMPQFVDTTAVIDTELKTVLHPSEEIFKISSERIYQNEIEKLLKPITDSVQLLRKQVTELQKQLAVLPDMGFTEEKMQEQPLDSLQTDVDFKQLIQVKNDTIAILSNQLNELKKIADLKADTVFLTKETVKVLKGDSLQADYEITRMLQAKNDTIFTLQNHLAELKKTPVLKTDTVFITKETVRVLKGDSIQTAYETTQMLQAKNDTIAILRKQLNELKTSGTIKSDTVYVVRETVSSAVAENQQTEYLNQQLLRAKEEQIQMLQNQLNAMHNAASRTPQQPNIPREPAQAQPLAGPQTDQFTLRQFQAQNDTIHFLRNQIRNLQLQPPKIDSVNLMKEAMEVQAAKELVSGQKTSDLFQSMQDSIQSLKTRVTGLEEQTLPGRDTTDIASPEVPPMAKTDTTLIVAFYEMGGIRPRDEVSVLKQIKDLCNNKNVTSITLSGFTDSSGNEIINKEITNKRLNYLSEKIIPWIEKEKIFFQNFGDIYASDAMVSDERRIEIRILTKQSF